MAFLALGSAGGIWAALRPGEPDLPRYQRVKEQDPEYRAGGPECEPARLRRLPANGEQERQQHACAAEAEDQRLKEDDLLQQTRSADAAQAVTWLAYNQSLTLVVGTILGGLTLLAAVAAAKFARDAAKETKRSADIAYRAARVTERQMRAYIDITDVDVVDMVAGKRPRAKAVLKNVGATPASGIRVAHQMYVSAKPETHRVTGLFGHWPLSGATLGPQGITRLGISTARELTEADLETFQKGEWGWVVATVVFYRDVSGKQRRTVSRVHSSQGAVDDNGDVVLTMARRGGRAS